MSNIRVDVSYTIQDGSEIVFRSPVDCSAVTGLIVYYPGADGSTASKVFALADAHGSNVGDIDHLFAENVVVKVILDVTESMAFVQNADTNAYLEIKFAEANQAAMDAQTAAGNAHAAANNAQTAANSANTAARNAQTSADNAQTAIDNHIADKENPHGVTAAQVGATTMTLLWENASPASNFASQTISMDLSEYDAIMLLTRRSTSIYDIGFGISVLGYRGFAQNLALYTEVSAGVFICGREFTPSASGIVISGGVYKFSNLAMSACNFDDAYAIPYRIYGIKMGGGSSATVETGNLLDNTKMLDGYRITSDGTAKELAAAICSQDYIDISKAQGTHLLVYVYNKDTASFLRCFYRMCFYDANKNMISYQECEDMNNAEKAALQIPDRAVYARVSFTNKGENCVYMVIRGASDTPRGYYD